MAGRGLVAQLGERLREAQEAGGCSAFALVPFDDAQGTRAKGHTGTSPRVPSIDMLAIELLTMLTSYRITCTPCTANTTHGPQHLLQVT